MRLKGSYDHIVRPLSIHEAFQRSIAQASFDDGLIERLKREHDDLVAKVGFLLQILHEKNILSNDQVITVLGYGFEEFHE